MDLSRATYTRDLKIATMRALDAGSTTGEIARKYQLSPKLLERWRGEWRAKGELAFLVLANVGPDNWRWTRPTASASWNVKLANSRWKMIS